MYTLQYSLLNEAYEEAAYSMWGICIEQKSFFDFYNMYNGCFFE